MSVRTVLMLDFIHLCCYIGTVVSHIFFAVLYRVTVFCVGTLTKLKALLSLLLLVENKSNFNVISLAGADRLPAAPLSQRPVRHLHVPSCGPADNHLYEDHHGRGRDHTGWVPENDTNHLKVYFSIGTSVV